MAIDLNQEPASNYTSDPEICGRTIGDIRKALMLSEMKGGTIEAYKKGWNDAIRLMNLQIESMFKRGN